MATKNIFENAVILDVTFHKPGNTRKGDKGEIDTSADKNRLGLSKKILQSSEYADVLAVANACRTWLASVALPGPMKAGSYIVPLEVLDRVYTRVTEAEAAYNAAADRFVAVIPELIERDREALKDQFCIKNYSAPEEARKCFYVERRLLDFSLPGQAKIGQFIYENEKKRVEQDLQNTANEIKLALREALQGLVGRLADALEVGPDGTKKVFRDTAVTKLKEYLDLFSARNIADDDELAELVKQAKGVLNGKTPDDLRTNITTRQMVKTEVARLANAAAQLVDKLPSRLISFDDE
jgi:hypothetical protein